MMSVRAILQQGLTVLTANKLSTWDLSRFRNKYHLVNPLCCRQFTAQMPPLSWCSEKYREMFLDIFWSLPQYCRPLLLVFVAKRPMTKAGQIKHWAQPSTISASTLFMTMPILLTNSHSFDSSGYKRLTGLISNMLPSFNPLLDHKPKWAYVST